MKARCHRCGQEYLAARNLAGKTVRCWTCGAANDGAGGAARDGVDGGEEPVDRGSTEAGFGQVVVEANPAVPIQAAPFVSPGPRPRPDLFRRLNRILIAVSGGLLFLATLGAFSIWFLSRPRAGSDGDWEPVQRAVPHIVSVAGSGSGFVTEIHGRLWLVTSYGIIDGVGSVKAIFDDPGSGAPGFSIEVSTESALVHEGFAGTPGEAGAWDVTALDIERWRPQFDGVGITPLAIDEGEGLRAGAPVVALGHSDGVPGPGAGTSGEFGTGVHSLVKGVVSTVRADGGRHRRLGTDARIGPGYRGGPLVLESSAKVVGVNGAQAAATSEDFGGLFPAVAADSVRELVDRGVPLSVIRGRISAASTSPLPGGVEHPETAWSRFNVLEERWERCRAQGWEWVDSIIRVTGDDGKDRVVHAVEGQGTRQVAVLAFPESPLVDLDIERFGPVGGPSTGERRLAPGMPTLVEARDPLSGDRSGSTGGTDITMEISARFLGTPIRARYVVVLIQIWARVLPPLRPFRSHFRRCRPLHRLRRPSLRRPPRPYPCRTDRGTRPVKATSSHTCKEARGSMAAVSSRSLVSAVTCPHCWHEFPPSDFRFLSEHDSLLGDPVLGPGEPLRFHPSRFDARCRPIDPLGSVCTRMACPRCHLEIPPALIEMPTTTISVVGAPGCGKSVMLAAASFSLRSGLVVPDLEFIDADPELNDLTVELESTLFRSSSPDRPAMIAKTDLSGRLYRSFRLADSAWTAPKPQLFLLDRRGTRRILCLYDNAGEHFLPGQDTAREPVTRHLGVSRAMVFVVDPTQDHRVVKRLGGREAVAAQGGGGTIEQRQDLVLIEAANRVRRLRSISVGARLPFRVILALSKADIWGGLVEPRLDASFGRGPGDAPVTTSVAVPSRHVLERAHQACCVMLTETMPELIATVRAIDPEFRVVPFSGLGRPPAPDPSGAGLAIRPSDVRPVWPAAPLVVALSEADRAVFPEYLRSGGTGIPSGTA